LTSLARATNSSGHISGNGRQAKRQDDRPGERRRAAWACRTSRGGFRAFKPIARA
jgi:hypothetical protein